MRTVLTIGTFDLLHIGHVNLLRQCKAIAGNGRVVVGLNNDSFVFRYKGNPPVVSYGDRETMLRACVYVDDVVPNARDEDCRPTILDVKPDFLVIGSDWATKDYYQQTATSQQWLDAHSITLCYVPYTQGVSTTAIKQRVKG